MKIIAFGASISKKSINKALAQFTATLVPGAEIEVLDLRDYDLPIFSTDLEQEIGLPPAARAFFDKIGSAEGVIVSFAEHNGSYSAAYKNLFDWASRIDQKVYQDKPAVFLSTSPGPGGAGSVLASAKGSAGFFGADLRAAVSVPSFHDVFDAATGHITEKDALKDLTAAAEALALQEVA
ncbi:MULTISPECIES: NADPH-dependent FMN reductase [Mameliella]|uniref:NADPH-dependent FMN reductase n=1 Tax=Mameliella TaxID=1434019 RepID=UPI000B52BF02|nr:MULTISPECIES: NAD(P)H-dependent oxidoreductase [Mameliella]MCR9271989.1 NAD(P)H-dependent oxidoreductase [Paracoccaceae bacterium]OWV62807.1 NADPH-dependent FMN reductase [Mameliella alba]